MKNNIWINQNWEHEIANDYIYSLERIKDEESSLQRNLQKPTKIIINNEYKKSNKSRSNKSSR